MIHEVFEWPKVKTDYFFFTSTYTHNHVFYKAAVAEEVTLDAPFTGVYGVTLVSDKGVQHLTVTKVEGGWKCESGLQDIH